jgi:hypothetical protein
MSYALSVGPGLLAAEQALAQVLPVICPIDAHCIALVLPVCFFLAVSLFLLFSVPSFSWDRILFLCWPLGWTFVSHSLLFLEPFWVLLSLSFLHLLFFLIVSRIDSLRRAHSFGPFRWFDTPARPSFSLYCFNRDYFLSVFELPANLIHHILCPAGFRAPTTLDVNRIRSG